MNRRLNQGSAHVIIIVIVIIAIVGALGYALYHTLSAAQPAATSGSQTQDSSHTVASTPTYVDGSIDKSFATNLTFKYPSSWTYKEVNNGTPGQDSGWTQKITLTSPSGKYSVEYYVGANGGFGGTCLPQDAGLFAKTSYEVVSGFPAASYVELFYKNKPSDTSAPGSPGFVGLMDTDAAKTFAVDASVCDSAMHNIISLNTSPVRVSLINASLSIVGADTSATLSAALSGTEYEQAKAILLSTVH